MLVVIIALVAILVCVWAYFVWVQAQKIKKDRSKVIESPEDQFEDTFNLMEKIFGPVSSIGARVSKGKRVVFVQCQNCQQENRLFKGLSGAKCGKCKQPLTKLDSFSREEIN